MAHEHDEVYDRQLLYRILEEQDKIRHQLHELRAYEFKNRSATLTFQGVTMPATIILNGNGAQAAFVEWSGLNGTGSQVAPVGAVTYASDNTAVATVDPNSGLCAAVSAGTANISGTDAGNSLTASDVLTVTGGVTPPVGAQSATLTLTAL